MENVTYPAPDLASVQPGERSRGSPFIESIGPPPHERGEGGVATGMLSKKNTCPLLFNEMTILPPKRWRRSDADGIS